MSRDAFDIYAGLLIFFIGTFFHYHRQLQLHFAIWAGVIVAISAELFDARDDLINHGLWRIGASMNNIII